LVAGIFLALSPNSAGGILAQAFHEFASVAILFTAVAVPAHLVWRSGAFDWLGSTIGHTLGVIGMKRPLLAFYLVPSTMLVLTYVTAALFHNITSVLVTVPIAVAVCSVYQIPSRQLLCGQLVASNLGGFSTSWGDTPNIIESATWGLDNLTFLREIVPINLIVLGGLIVIVIFLMRKGGPNGFSCNDPVRLARNATAFKIQRHFAEIDRRTLLIGLVTLSAFIAVQSVARQFEVAASGLTIALAVALDDKTRRAETLMTLGLDLYVILVSIFVIAGTLGHSWVGATMHDLVSRSQAAPWIIALTAYFGTLFTEAASWAATTAGAIFAVNPSHAAAWALGGGICAGSSSLVTAASAGIVLSNVSRRFKGHEIEFGDYLPFGLSISMGMLVFYSIVFTLIGKGLFR
jgi:Na+/H+ antiporter NhaD/arsenite permease-like protein